MRKFRFKLDTLLKVRSERLKVIQKELLEKQARCRMLEEEKTDVGMKIHEIEIELRARRARGDFSMEASYESYLNDLHANLNRTLRQASEESQKLLLKQKTASQAHLKRKIIEKLREKRYSLWQRYGKS